MDPRADETATPRDRISYIVKTSQLPGISLSAIRARTGYSGSIAERRARAPLLALLSCSILTNDVLIGAATPATPIAILFATGVASQHGACET